MTVGYFAPLPPARTGVADYAAALLAELKQHGSVELHTNRADVALYHLGNNQLHREIYQRALEHPGVVVLHDAVLHHFFLGSLSRAAYVDEFVYNYGEWCRPLAEEFWTRRASSASDPLYFDYPMLKRIAERSRRVVVHNPAAARTVLQHAPGAHVVEIPHLFAAPAWPGGWEVQRLRHSLGAPPSTFLFGVLGYLRESKRLFAVMRAFRWLRSQRNDVALLVAGEFASTDLARAIAPHLRAPGVTRLPFLPEPAFWRTALALDACINLRAPAAGETSGIAIRLMGAGKPVLLTDSAENNRYPATACLRVAPGLAEEDSLRAHLLLLTSVKDCAREIGSRASAYIASSHQAARVAQLYWSMLCAAR